MTSVVVWLGALSDRRGFKKEIRQATIAESPQSEKLKQVGSAPARLLQAYLPFGEALLCHVLSRHAVR